MTPVLAHYNPNLPICPAADALAHGIGNCNISLVRGSGAHVHIE